MIREEQIKHEAGSFWVLDDKPWKRYLVLKNVGTHSVSDSAYTRDDDGLSIAVARCNYLARMELSRLKEKGK